MRGRGSESPLSLKPVWGAVCAAAPGAHQERSRITAAGFRSCYDLPTITLFAGGFAMIMPLRVLCFWGLALGFAAPTLTAGDAAETGILVTRLPTEDAENQSAIPGGPLLAASCTLTWEETEADREEREDRKTGKDTSKSHYSS